ncbi:hypothetical protein Patl_0326 [Paraglaciecola sp. T6c]|uniref:hypothetical protein n=1 Tax=Pseudoalteromonas atlantica (strain T6c / ATCC BAA-1087) TaxID=3042615 RepID=UPI00005C5C88|nr:hypothetical protein [Paraglaciecola sp. T6c]ABG38857.1 hypothetical protein Patl_0326 [Paraglaciecola sp. T6c]
MTNFENIENLSLNDLEIELLDQIPFKARAEILINNDRTIIESPLNGRDVEGLFSFEQRKEISIKLKRYIRSLIDDLNVSFKQKICIELDFCKRLAALEKDRLELFSMLFDLLTAIFTSFPIATLTYLAWYLLKSGMHKYICSCP